MSDYGRLRRRVVEYERALSILLKKDISGMNIMELINECHSVGQRSSRSKKSSNRDGAGNKTVEGADADA